MERQHIDISRDLDGEPVVFAIFDLREEEIAASAHAVAASAAERYRNTEMSADDVVELRNAISGSLKSTRMDSRPLEADEDLSDRRDDDHGEERPADATSNDEWCDDRQTPDDRGR